MNKLLEWYVKFLNFFPRWLRRLIIWGIILQISMLGWIKLIREWWDSSFLWIFCLYYIYYAKNYRYRKDEMNDEIEASFWYYY